MHDRLRPAASLVLAWGAELSLALLTLTLTACGGAQRVTGCANGATLACVAADGSSGLRHCSTYGAYGDCVTDGPVCGNQICDVIDEVKTCPSDCDVWGTCGPDGPDLVLGPEDTFGEVEIEWVEHEWMRTRGRRLWIRFTEPAQVFVLAVTDAQAPAQLGQVGVNNFTWIGPGRSDFTPPGPGPNGDSAAYYSGVAGIRPRCLAVDALVWGDREGSAGRLVVQPRFEPPGNVLPIEVVIAGDLSLTQRRRETIIRHANTVLRASGAPRLEVVGVHRIDGPTAARYGTAAFNRWLASAEGDPMVPDLVFVDRVRGVRRSEDDSFAGRAHIPGAAFPGAGRSGMLVLARWGKNWRRSPAGIGKTVAHEVGHFLGLSHTTEKHGTRNVTLPDIPLCSIDLDADGDGELSSPECADFDGRNLMFWRTWENTVDHVWLSESQVRLMRLHPAVRYVPEGAEVEAGAAAADVEPGVEPGREPEAGLPLE